MPAETIQDLEGQIDQLITRLNIRMRDMVALRLAAAFVAGSRNLTSTVYSADKERLSQVQQNAIKRLSAEHFGYISEFNRAAGEQIKDRARELLTEGKGYADISKEVREYAKGVFGGSERIIINHVGQTRTVIQVGKNGTLRKIEKKITKPYVTNSKAYADMLARTSTHSAWEEGRALEYQRMGFKFWRFTGPSDERARDHHIAVLGRVYEYGTEQSDLALQLLHEPNCRHRQIPFFNDEDLDTPQSFYDEIKRKSGLYWDEEAGEWNFRRKTVDFGTTPKKEIPYTMREDLTGGEKEHIGTWQNESKPINAIPRKIEAVTKDMTVEEVERYTGIGLVLESIVKKSKLEDDMVLRRGIGEPIISRIKAGEIELRDHGFSAFSYHDGVPIRYAELVKGDDGVWEKHFFEMKAKKGQTALFIGDTNGHYDSEVLFAMGTTFYRKKSKSMMVSENGGTLRYVYHTVELNE
ncbi:phage minor head protein [Methanolobus psychrotolerans]|uniref:phage minor head protein n=1 Tax=Methanolobus psychrotolerans TaxID=1874706 RepID=UPI000B91AEFA|nr:phage minor head protein [Methanolobus psychrotolerans]